MDLDMDRDMNMDRDTNTVTDIDIDIDIDMDIYIYIYIWKPHHLQIIVRFGHGRQPSRLQAPAPRGQYPIHPGDGWTEVSGNRTRVKLWILRVEKCMYVCMYVM